MLLQLALACAKTHPPPAVVTFPPPVVTLSRQPLEQPVDDSASDPGSAAIEAPVSDYYDPVPEILAGCQLRMDRQDPWLAELACPGDRVLTDHRGDALQSRHDALNDLVETLATLGLTSLPRQETVALPGSKAVATVVDTAGPGPALTAWVARAGGPTPQVLTCMAMQGDTDAQPWCLAAMASILVPAAD